MSRCLPAITPPRLYRPPYRDAHVRLVSMEAWFGMFNKFRKERHMRILSGFIFTLALMMTGISSPVLAGNSDPLFVNMTTDDAHRANMAISFGSAQFERGHPLTIFLNDKGVSVASKANADKYGHHQKMLAEAMKKGAVVIVCPMCMKHYGVKKSDLLPGLKVGNPDFTGSMLFKDGTRTMTW